MAVDPLIVVDCVVPGRIYEVVGDAPKGPVVATAEEERVCPMAPYE
jgi:hypothetical protein